MRIKLLPEISDKILWEFNRRIIRQEGCWEWRGVEKDGVAYLWIKDYYFHASRIAWKIYHDEDPGELLVCHTCDNPMCVREDHLFLGTHQDNAIDRENKGRHPHIFPVGFNRKLTPEQEIEVLKLMDGTRYDREIALKFGVGRTTIRRIMKRHHGKK